MKSSVTIAKFFEKLNFKQHLLQMYTSKPTNLVILLTFTKGLPYTYEKRFSFKDMFSRKSIASFSFAKSHGQFTKTNR